MENEIYQSAAFAGVKIPSLYEEKVFLNKIMPSPLRGLEECLDCESCNSCGSGDCNSCCESSSDD